MNYLYENIRVINPATQLDEVMNVLIGPGTVALNPQEVPEATQKSPAKTNGVCRGDRPSGSLSALV